MKKLFLLFAFGFLAFPVWGQTTAVTGTVLDPTGKPYQGCSVNISYVPSPTATTVPTINGSTFQTTIPVVSCDSFGNFSTTLTDTSLISDGRTGSQGPLWAFFVRSGNICYVGQTVGFNVSLPITGASENVTTSLQSAAATLPTCGGGGGPSISLQTNSVTNSNQTVLNLKNGTNVTITSDAGGGVTINSPAANILPLNNIFTGTDAFKGTDPYADIVAFGARAGLGYTLATATCSSGSNQVVINDLTDIQLGDGITVYGCGPSNTLGTPATPAVTPSTAGGEPGMGYATQSLNYTGASTYKYAVVARDQFGGLTVASATTTITTGPPTLGKITYNISSISRSGNTVTVQTSANVVTKGTLVCVSGVAGQQFDGCFTADQIDSGTQFEFFNVPIDTHGTGYFSGDTPSESSGTATIFVDNTISWTPLANAWEYYVYAQRPGDSALNLIGVTQPQGVQNGYIDNVFEDYGATFLGNQSWPSYVPTTLAGATLPTADPLTATVTNIVIGSTTATLTLACPCNNSTAVASQNAMNEPALHDDAPGILAAMNSIAYHHSGSGYADSTVGGPLYIPPTTHTHQFHINSYLLVPEQMTVWQAGAIVNTETIAIQGDVKWEGFWGDLGVPQFGYAGASTIQTLTANPALYIYGTGVKFGEMEILSNNANGGVLAVEDNAAFTSWDYVSFVVNGGGLSTDYWGRDLIIRDTTETINNQYFNKTLFGGGPTQVTNASWTPLVMLAIGQNGSGSYAQSNIVASFSSVQINRRGFGSVQDGESNSLIFNGLYRQGGISPLVASYNSAGNTYVSINDGTQDTETEPAVSQWSTAGAFAKTIGNITLNGVNGGAGDPLISGRLPQNFNLTGWTVGTTQGAPNREGSWNNAQGSQMYFPPYGSSSSGPCGVTYCMITGSLQVFDETTAFGDGRSLLWFLGQPSSVSGTAASSGSVPVGNWYYAVNAVGADGGFTIASLPSSVVTTSGGTQTVNVTWTGVLGAVGYNVYRCTTSCVTTAGTVNTSATWYRVSTANTGTSYSDTAAAPTQAFLPTTTATGVTIADPNGFYGNLFQCPETTAPTGVANFDLLYCNAADHRFKIINNNGTGSDVATLADFGSPPALSAADTYLGTAAIGVGQWAPMPACLDSGGNHLNYNTSTHAFSCGTTGGTAGSAAFNTITSGTNNMAAMVCTTGCSIATSGSGTNTATAVPFSGVSAATSTAALVIGTGGSLSVSGSGTNYATSLLGSTWASPGAQGTGTPNTAIFSALTDTALSTTTSPICPNGAGGAFTTSGCVSGGSVFPVTVSGTTTSGGIPYFSATTTETSSGILNTNILVKGGGAGGAPTNSSITDNGTTVSTSEPLSAGNASFGGGCSAAGSTASGGICMTESANTGWTPASGQDYMRADSTAHDFLCSINGAAEPGCTFGAPTTVNNNGIATTPTDSFEAFNNTASTSGAAAQDCPSYAWLGHVWNTTPTAADNFARWIAYCTVTSGTGPYTTWTLADSVDTGSPSYTGRFSVNSFGQTFAGSVNFSSSFGVGSSAHLLASTTAPTIASGFNTSGYSVAANNGTAAFVITVGTGSGTSTGVITLPTASTGWNCFATNRSRADFIGETATNTTSATLTNYGTGFSATNFTNSDTVQVSCFAY